ncbi:unnamed protein product [Gongylonema pulchrum]|nr:unnamed protein product [Gongylonema pulchrum]
MFVDIGNVFLLKLWTLERGLFEAHSRRRPAQNSCRDDVVGRANEALCRWTAEFGAYYPNEGDTLKG